jgi:superfamily II DNA or RNA helicase
MACIEVRKLNESISAIHTSEKADEDLLEDLKSYFTVEVKNAKWMPKMRYGNWDGRIAYFNPSKGIIYNGLLDKTEQWCKNNGIEFRKDNFTEWPEMEWKEFVGYNKKILKGTKYVPRDYQEKACLEALNKRHGILECCTSSGKSLIIYLFIRHLLRFGVKNILLCVPNITLVNQMYSDFKDYGWTDLEQNCEKLYGGETPSFDKPVLISTWQSLQNKEKPFFEKFDGVVYDECHSSKAKVVNSILKACVNSFWRIGTTGTLPDDKNDLMMITCVLGKVLYRIAAKELIDRGFLTKLIVANLFVKYPIDFIKQRICGSNYANEVAELEGCEARNRVIDSILGHLPKEHNILFLVNHVAHVDKVADYIRKKFPERQVEIITGKVKADKREEIRQDAEKFQGLVIVATYQTCSTGVNIKKLHGIVLYADSASKIRVLQSLGRGLRQHSTKKKVILYDVIDDCRYTKRTGKVFKNCLFQHWETRKQFYEQEGYPQMNLDIKL